MSQGGNDGSALNTGLPFSTHISGAFTDYGGGGVGATSSSTPQQQSLECLEEMEMVMED